MADGTTALVRGKPLSVLKEETLGLSAERFVQGYVNPFLVAIQVTDTSSSGGFFTVQGDDFGAIHPPTLPPLLPTTDITFIEIHKRAESAFEGRIFVGRTKTKDVYLRHESISKSHAFFERDEKSWSLTDSGSTNGTWVRGERLEVGKGVELSSGDCIVFGEIPTYFVSAAEMFELIETLQT